MFGRIPTRTHRRKRKRITYCNVLGDFDRNAGKSPNSLFFARNMYVLHDFEGSKVSRENAMGDSVLGKEQLHTFFRPTSANGGAFHFFQLLDGTVKAP